MGSVLPGRVEPVSSQLLTGVVSPQVERLEVVNKRYVKVVSTPGTPVDGVSDSFNMRR